MKTDEENFLQRVEKLRKLSHNGLVTQDEVQLCFLGADFRGQDIRRLSELLMDAGLSMVDNPGPFDPPKIIHAVKLHSDMEKQGQIMELVLDGKHYESQIRKELSAGSIQEFPVFNSGLHLMIWCHPGEDPQKQPLPLPVMILSRPYGSHDEIILRNVVITKANTAGQIMDFAPEDRKALSSFINENIRKLNALHDEIHKNRKV